MKFRIFGAGFSGLTLAYLLIRKGYQVEVFEQSDRLGGLIDTQQSQNLFSESAANGLMASDDIIKMLNDLEVKYVEAQSQSAKRYIFRDKKRRWPLSVLESIILAFRFLVMRILKRHQPKPFETVYDWGCRVIGKPGTEYLLQPALQGIYAGNIKTMSATLIIGKFFLGKRSPMGRLISPEGGMNDLLKALGSYILAKGGKIFLNSHHQQMNEPFSIGALSAKTYKDLYFNRMELLSLVKVTVRWSKSKTQGKRIDGFGVLFPTGQGFRALGVLSCFDIFGRKLEEDTEAWIFGGALDSNFIKLSDQEIIEILKQDRIHLLNQHNDILEYKIHRWPNSLPHYNLELEKHLSSISIEDKMQHSGNFMGELGLSRIFMRNMQIVEYWSKNHES